MDRISLTWEAALADPPAAAALLRRLEEQAEAYITRSRTLRQWLENVPPLTAMGTFLPTSAPEDQSLQTPEPEAGTDGASPKDGTGGGSRTREGRIRTEPDDGGPDRDEAGAGTVPPQRRTAEREEAGPGPADGQDAAAAPRTGGDGRRKKKAAPPGGQLPTLYERVEAVLDPDPASPLFTVSRCTTRGQRSGTGSAARPSSAL
ncbi:hypothetical protein [Streptomyces sp. NBC_01238]|uniref:hypothetical protein n=1 Tax=unclassified Streptomyces TaxID=2593676 RepID=UPI0038633739|nr:hypothetical protein OG508_06165 [Streptomyces sp. NBC_01108]